MKAGARRIGDDDRRGDTVADEGGQDVADLYTWRQRRAKSRLIAPVPE